jgi:hypothetical protein
MNFQKTPLALAVALTFSCSPMESAQALPPAVPIHLAGTAHRPGSGAGFDDSMVTVIADDWDEVDDGTLDTVLLGDEDPFEITTLGDDRVSVIAAYGSGAYAKKDPCAKYSGKIKLTATPLPKGGVIYGGGLNCGKSVPTGAYGGRVCSVSRCKNYGGPVALKAVPVEGYRFVKWGDACKKRKNDPYCTVNWKSDKKVSAVFKKIKKR